MSLAKAHLRVARPTDQLAAVVKFYRDGLGLEVLYEFQDHDGFDGVMLGHKAAGYHLEFTCKRGHAAGKAPSQDNLLVLYIPDRTEWAASRRRSLLLCRHAASAVPHASGSSSGAHDDAARHIGMDRAVIIVSA